MRTAHRVRTSFDGSACAARRETERFSESKLRTETRALGSLVRDLSSGMRLDVACGTGSLGATLGAGCSLIGLDSSAAMVAAARRTDAYDAVFVGDATRLPFRSDSFASGSVIRLLHHLDTDDRRGVLQELRRVVSGRAIVSFFDASTLEAVRAKRRRSRRGSRRAITLAELSSDAAAVGWRLRATSRKMWRLTEHVYALLEPADPCEATGDGR